MTILSAGLPMLVFLAKATLILIAALAITVGLQRASAGTRHLVWLVTLAALLLVPALTAWSPIRLRILPPAAANTSSPFVSSSSFSQKRNIDANTPVNTNSPAPADTRPESGAVQAASFTSSISLTTILLAIWAVVVLAIALSLGYAALVVRGIVRRATVLDGPDWVKPLWEVSDRLGLDQPPRLLRSEDAKMPFACGVLKPTIVVPAECDSWSLDRRHAVLLHELAHVRRHDLVGHTLGRLVCAIYWFHPLVWTAAKNLRSESERACDDLALSCGAKATDYAEHLLDIVTSVRRDSTPSVALAMARRKEFEGRMLAILDPDLRHSSPGRRETIFLTATLALTALVVGAAAPVARVQPTTAQSVKAPSVTESPAVIHDATKDLGPIRFRISEVPVEADAKAVAPTTLSVNPTVSVSTSQSTSFVQRMNVVNSIIQSGKGPKGDKGPKDTDDRPILLAKILRTEPSAELRRIAAWGLAEYADGIVAADALAEALRKDSDERVREMAAWALGNGDNHAGVQALIAALRGDASLQVRTTAAWALGDIGDKSATDVLVAALGDTHREIRIRAIWALGNVGPREAPRALVAMLRDPDPKVREITAWALYNIEDESTVPALDAALRVEQNKELQLDYIRALAALGEKSVDAIKGLLDSPDPRIKTMAVQALAGGNAAGPWPWPWPEPRPQP